MMMFSISKMNNPLLINLTEQLNNTKEDDLEFAFTFGHPYSPMISAEFKISKSSKPPPPATRQARLPLRKLFIEERDTPQEQ